MNLLVGSYPDGFLDELFLICLVMNLSEGSYPAVGSAFGAAVIIAIIVIIVIIVIIIIFRRTVYWLNCV